MASRHFIPQRHHGYFPCQAGDSAPSVTTVPHGRRAHLRRAQMAEQVDAGQGWASWGPLEMIPASWDVSQVMCCVERRETRRMKTATAAPRAASASTGATLPAGSHSGYRPVPPAPAKVVVENASIEPGPLVYMARSHGESTQTVQLEDKGDPRVAHLRRSHSAKNPLTPFGVCGSRARRRSRAAPAPAAGEAARPSECRRVASQIQRFQGLESYMGLRALTRTVELARVCVPCHACVPTCRG